jgi:uncharacterized protein YprB with RNaseH-like and TPR domain
MHDLRSKLELYRENHSSANHIIIREQGLDIQDICQGTVYSGDNGACFVIENSYPVSYLYGGYRLGDACDINIADLKRVCGEIDSSLGLQDFLFLDTETTGLSGGTGTVAFLVGLGFFRESSFVIRQYFMRDYNEEAAMLEAINGLMAGYKALVTFNGKAFDWNLLSSRFITNRMRCRLKNPPNLDLLFPARRLWKLKLESCSLSSLEENILDEYRVDDIPGALIPSVYFEYLESRNASEIMKVTRHNGQDILSMVPLLVKIASMLDNPLSESCEGEELLGLGRIFEANGEFNMVIDCFESCMKSEDRTVKGIAAKRLSDIYKRSGNYGKAVEHWNSILADPGTLNIYPMIELAKYYEHKLKDIGKALEIAEKAMHLASQTGVRNNIYYNDLAKRLLRLKRKAGRVKNA